MLEAGAHVPQDVLRRWCLLGALGVTVVVAYGTRRLRATGHTRDGWSVLAHRAHGDGQVTPIFPVNDLQHAIEKIEREVVKLGWVPGEALHPRWYKKRFRC